MDLEIELGNRWAELTDWLHYLFGNSMMAMAYFDESLHCRYLNRAFSRFAFLSCEVATGKSLWAILPGLAPRLDQKLRDAMRTGTSLSLREMIVASQDAQVPARHILLAANPVSPPGENLPGIIVVLTDISERKTLEQDLASMNLFLNDRCNQTEDALNGAYSQVQVLSNTLRSMREGVLVYLENGKAILNPVASKLLGISSPFPMEMTEYSKFDHWITDQHKALFSLEDLKTGKGSEYREVWFQNGSSLGRWLGVQVFPLADAKGVGAVVVLRDISLQKRKEEKSERKGAELRSANERLSWFPSGGPGFSRAQTNH